VAGNRGLKKRFDEICIGRGQEELEMKGNR